MSNHRPRTDLDAADSGAIVLVLGAFGLLTLVGFSVVAAGFVSAALATTALL